MSATLENQAGYREVLLPGSLDFMSPNSVYSSASGAFGQGGLQSDSNDIDIQIDIPGAPFVLPHRRASIRHTGSTISIVSRGEQDWPGFQIDLITESSTGINGSIKVFAHDSGRSVDSQIQLYRVLFFLYRAGKFSASSSAFGHVEVPFGTNNKNLKDDAEENIKICLKLKFIETVFQIRFSFPQRISWSQMREIDIVFRGITEGDFVTRCPYVDVPVRAKEIDISSLPIEKPGQLTETYDTRQILGREIPLGRVTTVINQALVVNARIINKMLLSGADTIPIRYSVVDHQAVTRFEKYASKTPAERSQRINKFKYSLEQRGMADLIPFLMSPLIKDVSTTEAVQIAFAWLQLNDFRDRFCPQEPELDEAASCWRVPIYVVYANGENAPVSEIRIDLKTGAVTPQVSPEEMKDLGLAAARQLLHVE